MLSVPSNLNPGLHPSNDSLAQGKIKGPGSPKDKRQVPSPNSFTPTNLAENSLPKDVRRYTVESKPRETLPAPLSHFTNVNHPLQQQEDSSVEFISEKVYGLMKKRKFDQAEKLLRPILEKDSNHLNARIALGWALLGQSRASEAEAEFAHVLEKHPDNWNARTGSGWALLGQGLLGPAEAEFRRVIDKQPDNLEARGGLAEVLYFQRSATGYHEAESQFREVLYKQFDNLRARLMLGRALRRQSRNYEAEVEFQRVLEMEPENLEVRIELAEVLSSQNKYSDAKMEWRRVLEMQPNNVPAIEMLNNALSEEEKFRRILASRPDDLNVRTNLGKALFNQSNHGEAEAQYRRVLQKQPDNLDAREGLGRVLYRQTSYFEAEVEFRRVIQKQPNNWEAKYWLAMTLYAQERHSEAEVEFRSILAKSPLHLNARAALGLALLKQSKNGDAEAELLAVLKMQRDNFDARFGLAMLLNAKNYHFQAMVEWMLLVTEQSNNLLCILGVGWSRYCQALESNNIDRLKEIENYLILKKSSLRKVLANKAPSAVMQLLREKNIEFLRELHRIDSNITKDLLYKAIVEGLSQEYIEIVLKNSFFDPKFSDWEGNTAFHAAVIYHPELLDMLQRDPNTRQLVEVANIYGEKPHEYLMSRIPLVNQAKILENLKAYAKMRGRESEINKLFFKGHCKGFSFLHNYYQSIGKVDHFYQVLYDISSWDRKADSLNEAVSIPGFADRKECFEQWLNDLVIFQNTSPIVCEAQAVLGQNDRARQFELAGPANTSLKLVPLQEGIILPSTKNQELVESLTFLTLYRGFSFEFITGPPVNHMMTVYVDKSGELHFYDSNHTKRLKEVQHPEAIARMYQKSVTWFQDNSGIDNQTEIPFVVYGYWIGEPSQMRKPNFDEANKLLKEKGIQKPVSAFALLVGDKALFHEGIAKDPKWVEFYFYNRSYYQQALNRLRWKELTDSGRACENLLLGAEHQNDRPSPLFINYW